MARAGWSQRYCTKCGRRMIPYQPHIYTDYEWLQCPRHRWPWEMFTSEHDVAIVGRHDETMDYRFDPVSGQRIGVK